MIHSLSHDCIIAYSNILLLLEIGTISTFFTMINSTEMNTLCKKLSLPFSPCQPVVQEERPEAQPPEPGQLIR